MEPKWSSMLRELELIWTEIGETEAAKNGMLLEIEKECMQVYKNKVDEASNERTRLRHVVALKQAELATLRASLGVGESSFTPPAAPATTLKEKEALLTPQLEELTSEKQEREKLLMEIKSQIDKINLQLFEHVDHKHEEGHHQQDLSMRRINKYQTHLRNLQAQKLEHAGRVLDCVYELRGLCRVLGMEFGNTLDQVQPGLHERLKPQAKVVITMTKFALLSEIIRKLEKEKKSRAQKLRDSLGDMYELWDLMDTRDNDKIHFWKLASVSKSTDDEDIKDAGVLSPETLQQVKSEIERLRGLKISRMKQVVLSRRMELETIWRRAHMEPDSSTSPEKLCAMMDSGIAHPSQLVETMEAHIAKANQEARSRKDMMRRVAKWANACNEEKWLEDYNKDDRRYNAGRGAHLNLKRAEKARMAVTKIPAMVGDLMKKTLGWEDERGEPLMYDGVRLVSILEDYKLCRLQKEEEDQRYKLTKKKKPVNGDVYTELLTPTRRLSSSSSSSRW